MTPNTYSVLPPSRIPRPRIKKTGTMYECKSRHPTHAGCILICICRTPERAYLSWLQSLAECLFDFHLQIHPNREV